MESKLLQEFRDTLKEILYIGVQVILNFLYTFETDRITDRKNYWWNTLLKAYRTQTFQEKNNNKNNKPLTMPTPFFFLLELTKVLLLIKKKKKNPQGFF